ncbi:MAG: STAS domain-containing protein [Chloroflexi bacterium]|nr:STAS domain-containing protein [Chloroflexota bacterium]
MEISIKKMNRVDLLIVVGRVDSTTASELGDKLDKQISAGTVNLVVDLAGAEYMSSAGLRELVGALKRVKKDGGDLRLSSPSERVQEVLELAGLNSVFEIYDDQVTAVGSF